MNRRETIEGLVSKAKELSKRLYIGHVFQCDVYGQLLEVRMAIREALEDRIRYVLRVFDEMPQGEWSDTGMGGKDTFFSSWKQYRKHGSKRLSCYDVTKEAIFFKYNKGFEEEETVAFPIGVLAEDDDEVVRAALMMQGESKAKGKVGELEERLLKAKKTVEAFARLSASPQADLTDDSQIC